MAESHLGKQKCADICQSLKLRYTHQLSNFASGIYPKKVVMDVPKVLAARMFSSALFKIMKFGNYLNAWQ